MISFFLCSRCTDIELPIKSDARVPRNSPRMVIRVPGGPSFGDKPVTTGWGAI